MGRGWDAGVDKTVDDRLHRRQLHRITAGVNHDADPASGAEQTAPGRAVARARDSRGGAVDKPLDHIVVDAA